MVAPAGDRKDGDDGARLLAQLQARPESLLEPDETLKKQALHSLKGIIDPVIHHTTVLDQIYLDGMTTGQVWEQLNLAVDECVSRVFSLPSKSAFNQDQGSPKDMSDLSEDLSEGLSEGFSEGLSDGSGDIGQVESGQDGSEVSGSESIHSESDDLPDLDERPDQETSGEDLKEDAFGLNDEFFDIDEFNRQTLQQEDDEMDPEDDGEQEDGIDYSVDPDDLEEPTELYYNDFFAPPRRARPSQKRKRDPVQDETDEKPRVRFASPEPSPNEGDGPDEGGLGERVRADLFDEEEGQQEDKSWHERQQERLGSQIREMEKANVSEKEWALMGEASGRSRPKDSLLEQDESGAAGTGNLLEFEQNRRPVPVITEQVTSTLEDMIKQRIINNAFDDIVYRPPETEPEMRKARDMVELDESKSSKSLGEIYEQEHMQRTNPEQYRTEAQEKSDAEHAEISEMWRVVSTKLDALSSWHYKPAPAKSQEIAIKNVPSYEMEEARPSAETGGHSLLAPQDVYMAGRENTKEERVGRGGQVTHRGEMTSAEKRAAKRRDKNRATHIREKRKRKQQSKDSSDPLVRDLRAGNVKVIGRQGEHRDVQGRLVKSDNKAAGQSYKL